MKIQGLDECASPQVTGEVVLIGRDVVDVRWYNGKLQMARKVEIYRGSHPDRVELCWYDVPSITEEVNDAGSSQCQGSTDPISKNK